MGKRWFNRLFACSLAFATLACVSCEEAAETAEETRLTEADVEIWSTYNTEKILKANYEPKYKFEPAIDIVSANGEVEGAQIMITPTADVESFNVTASELTHEDGKTVLPADRISVYKQLYVNVAMIDDTAWGSVAGWYPDALLPFEAAVAFDETAIKADENQGLYFTYDLGPQRDENGDYVYDEKGDYIYLPSGTYTGSVEIDFGTFQKTVPVKLEVLDVVVSEESHMVGAYGMRRAYGNAELNFTEEMKDKYTEFFYSYRINVPGLVDDFSFSEAGMKYYVEKSYEMMQNPRCTLVEFPVANKKIEFYDVEDGMTTTETSFDRDKFKQFVHLYVQKSLETDFNMVKYLAVELVDEPSSHNLLKQTRAMCLDFKAVVLELEQEILALDVDESDKALQAELAQSAKNMRNIITEKYYEMYAPYIDTWCPYFAEGYASEELRAQYANQAERWTYATNISFESPLAFPRALSWMMAEYDITGMLNWDCALFSEATSTGYMPVEDYYTTAYHTYSTDNGNGYLAYPGGPYGVDGPIPSLRLQAFRDGIEEYEMIYAMKNRYKEISEQSGYAFTADKVVENLGSTLYAGTTVQATSEAFAQARTSLLQLIQCMDSAANMCIVDFNDDSYGNITYKVYMNDGYALQYNGAAVTNYETVSGGRIYTVSCKLSGTTNSMTLSFEADGKTYVYEQGLGGKATAFEGETFANYFTKGNVTPTVNVVPASEIYPERNDALTAANNKMLQLTLDAVENRAQRVKFMGGLIDNLDGNAKTLVVHVYLPPNESGAEEELAFELLCQIKGQEIARSLYKTKLKTGKNVLEIPLTSVDWTRANVEYWMMNFGDGSNSCQRNVCIKDMVLYEK